MTQIVDPHVVQRALLLDLLPEPPHFLHRLAGRIARKQPGNTVWNRALPLAHDSGRLLRDRHAVHAALFGHRSSSPGGTPLAGTFVFPTRRIRFGHWHCPGSIGMSTCPREPPWTSFLRQARSKSGRLTGCAPTPAMPKSRLWHPSLPDQPRHEEAVYKKLSTHLRIKINLTSNWTNALSKQGI